MLYLITLDMVFINTVVWLQGAHGGDEAAVSKVKKQPPSVAPNPQLGGGAQSQIQEPRKRPGKEPYDASNLPSEIASFVTTVRNHSIDGGDSSISGTRTQHSRKASAVTTEAINEKSADMKPSSAVERSQRMPVEISSTYDVPRSSVSHTHICIYKCRLKVAITLLPP